MKNRTLLSIAFAWVFMACHLTYSHQPGSSSLVLYRNSDGSIQGEYHVADVDLVSIDLMLEDIYNRTETSGEFQSAVHGARALAFLKIAQDGTDLVLQPGQPQPVQTDGRLHTMIPFTLDAMDDSDLEVTLVSFFDFDPQHRVVASFEQLGDRKVGLMTIDNTRWTISLQEPGALSQFMTFTWEGVFHIWIGIDHILFLVALLLPSVLRFQNGRWQPVSGFHDAFMNVIKVVTAFTVAHSITLSLAALQVVTLPSQFVESVIALSVVLAALNNLYPVVRERTWTVAFGFGLIHGFGFANVLADLSLPGGTLAIALLSFNVGVEFGQLAIVLAMFPFIFLLREHRIYLPLKLRFGSAVIALIACGWMVDRIFGLEMMPF